MFSIIQSPSNLCMLHMHIHHSQIHMAKPFSFNSILPKGSYFMLEFKTQYKNPIYINWCNWYACMYVCMYFYICMYMFFFTRFPYVTMSSITYTLIFTWTSELESIGCSENQVSLPLWLHKSSFLMATFPVENK